MTSPSCALTNEYINNGLICMVCRSLTLFIRCYFQIFVRAYDLGFPQLSSANQATVRINVIRNQNCPVFNNLPTEISISQSQSTNIRVFNVSATDLDPAVSSFLFMKKKILSSSFNTLFKLEILQWFL